MIAKRRTGATLISYLTPPVAHAGLYRGLADLKASLDRCGCSSRADAGQRATLSRPSDPGAGRDGRTGGGGAGLDRGGLGRASTAFAPRCWNSNTR